MTEKFYFDTSIWLDLYEKRGINGELAFMLVLKILQNNWIVVVSDAVVKEFKNLNYSPYEIKEIISIVGQNNLLKIRTSNAQKEESDKMALMRKIPKGDALHAILSRNNDSYFITRDHHFNKLNDITTVKKPEEII